jgi:hypothetical protein
MLVSVHLNYHKVIICATETFTKIPAPQAKCV